MCLQAGKSDGMIQMDNENNAWIREYKERRCG